METVEILRRAKALLTPETWGQGRGLVRPPPGTRCMEMALDYAAPKAPVGPALDLLMEVTGCGRLARWQDQPGRTLAEVHAAFDRAIALASPPPGSQPPGSKEGA